MIRSRIESARALPPSLSCQPSGMNWEQKIVDAWPHRYSINSRRSLHLLYLSEQAPGRGVALYDSGLPVPERAVDDRIFIFPVAEDPNF